MPHTPEGGHREGQEGCFPGWDGPAEAGSPVGAVGQGRGWLFPQVGLLRHQLLGLLDRFLVPEPKDPLGLMEILGDILHHLGAQGIGAMSLSIAQHLLQLSEDVSGVPGTRWG